MAFPRRSTPQRSFDTAPPPSLAERITFLVQGMGVIERTVLLGACMVAIAVMVPFALYERSVYELDTAAQSVAQALHTARLYAQANRDSTTWGVYVPQATVYAGQVYGVRQPEHDETFPLPTSVETIGMDDISFRQIDGVPSRVGDVIVASRSADRERIIHIDASGNAVVSVPIRRSTQRTQTAASHSASPPVARSASSLAPSRLAGGSALDAHGFACPQGFAIENGTLVSRGTNDIQLAVRGSYLTYGSAGPAVDVRMAASTNGGKQWDDLFGALPLRAGATDVIRNVPDATPLSVRLNGGYSWLLRRELRSDAHDGHVLLLRNGDAVPESSAFRHPDTLAPFLRPLVVDGHIAIGPTQAVLLAEFGSLDSATADFQDAVVLVTFLQKPSTCADPTLPSVTISIDRLRSSGEGRADRRILVGPQGLAFAERQPIALLDRAGNAIVDGGILRGAHSLAVERGDGWVKLLHAGGLTQGKEIMDITPVFHHAVLTSMGNAPGIDASENPRDGIVNDGTDGDEFIDGLSAHAMTFATRVTTDNDGVVLHWRRGEEPAPASVLQVGSGTVVTPTVAGQSMRRAVSSAVAPAPADLCAVPFAIDPDGMVVVSALADATLVIAGTSGTYGKHGPPIDVRTRISFDGGTTWQPLFGYAAVRGGDTAVFHAVPAGSRIRLDFDGRYSWVFHRTAQSGTADLRVRTVRRGQVLADVPLLRDASTIKGFLAHLLLPDARADVTTHQVLYAVELDEMDDTADYQDAVAVLSLDKPAGTEGCEPASSSPSSSSLSSSRQSSVASSSSLSSLHPAATSNPNPNLNPIPDSDGDSVADADDLCPGTSLPEAVPTGLLAEGRFALRERRGVPAALSFRTGPLQRISPYSIADTRGCSCEQLLDVVDGTNAYRFTEFPALYRLMRNFFSFYVDTSRQSGCGGALMDLVSGSRPLAEADIAKRLP